MIEYCKLFYVKCKQHGIVYKRFLLELLNWMV